MRPVKDGIYGILGNVESASCRLQRWFEKQNSNISAINYITINNLHCNLYLKLHVLQIDKWHWSRGEALSCSPRDQRYA